MKKNFDIIIDELCKEKNIEIKELSYGWIKELKKGDKIHHIIGNKLDLNTEISYEIVNDKFATYEVLNANNIPIVEHKMIFNPKTRSDYYKKSFIEEAKKLLLNNKKVVVKANDSYQGKDVYLCENEIEIYNVIDLLFKNENDSLSVCPFLDIDFEYRCLYLFGDIIYSYKKEKPFVVGDGVNNLYKLIKNKEEKENINIEVFKNIDLNRIPENNEKVIISWKHNLNNGAIPILINDTDEYVSQIKEIAKKAGDLLNIKFASVDVSLTSNKEIYVMEVNGNVCMNKFSCLVQNGYEIVKNIYSKAIDKMFE